MIDLDKYNEHWVKDMSTIKFARSVWPSLVTELKLARKVVGLVSTLEHSGLYVKTVDELLKAVAEYYKFTLNNNCK